MVVAGNQLGGQDRAKAACRVKLSAAKQACLPPTQRGPDELVPAAASLNENSDSKTRRCKRQQGSAN